MANARQCSIYKLFEFDTNVSDTLKTAREEPAFF